MKRFTRVTIYFLSLFLIAVSIHIYYLTTLGAEEKYPADSYLNSEQNKTALIIVAHDDDMATSAGTMSMLSENGWNIRELCFYQMGGLYYKKDSARNPVRKKSLKEVAKIQGLSGADPVDFNFRRDLETEKSYMPMPYTKFSENYKLDSLSQFIGAYIEKYKPAVIFTLDSIMGGYGHPDHVVISQRVMDYCRIHKNDSGFTVKKIYQAVFTPSLSEKIMKNMPVYHEAKEVYHTGGMPVPDVQISISGFTKQKKQVLKAYTTEQNSLRKIWPYYHWYPHWIYFRIFDRDFYSVIDVNKL